MILLTRITLFIFISIIAALSLTGCSASLTTRMNTAYSIAENNGFTSKIYRAPLFNIFSFERITTSRKHVTIFIEGDGLAWENKRRISDNPTPQNPVALKLAAVDQSDNIIYLARPCQYLDLSNELNCRPEVWTSKRASEEVVQALDTAIEQIVQTHAVTGVRLVGYSGGGTLAALLAARRLDVIDLRTVAGNLDIDLFATYHKVTPLNESINPVSLADQLINIPQMHYFSTQDDVIVPAIIDSYIAAINQQQTGLTCLFSQAFSTPTHTSGWDAIWQALPDKFISCLNDNL